VPDEIRNRMEYIENSFNQPTKFLDSKDILDRLEDLKKDNDAYESVIIKEGASANLYQKAVNEEVNN
jgi:hypothetical protein